MRKKIFWSALLIAVFLVTGATQVWADPPVADFVADPLTGKGRITTFNFTDQSTGTVESWLWEFGDGGTSTSQNPSHQYSNVGTYTVRLTVDGSEGPDVEEKIDYITVTMGAEFTTNTPREGPGPLPVLFDERCSRPVDTWEWDFEGDGIVDSTEKDPYHTYNDRGLYTVTMTCTGPLGTDTITKTDYVNVTSGARIITNRQSGRIPLTVNFSSASTPDVTGWAWDFDGDGFIDSTEENPGDVVYDTEGLNNVKLTATGGIDGTITDTEWIVAVNPWGKYVKKLASPEPDECFNGLGERVDPVSTDPFVCPNPSPETGLPIPMTNQTYVWSLTEVDIPGANGNHSLWFGTGANVLCTTQGALISEVDAGGGGTSICEFGESPMVDLYPNVFSTPFSQALADWRRAKIYRYDLDSGLLIDKTPPMTEGLFNICLGLRSGFSYVGPQGAVVFLAGGSFPGLGPGGSNTGVVMFAYNGLTGEYIGQKALPQYRTVRKGGKIGGNDGYLYFGVGANIDFPALGAGRILKWIGFVDADPTPAEVFQFEEVGNMPNIDLGGPAYGGTVRELAEYIDGDGNSRIAVSAKGVWLSPPIPMGGLTNADYGNWELVFSPAEYEPDFVTLQTYVGGGIESLNGWIYWATMHIPGNAADVHRVCTIPPLPITLFGADQCMGQYVETLAGRELNSAEYNAIYNNTSRATTLWRIKNAEDTNPANRQIQLLFGESELGQFNPDGGYDPTDPEANPNDAWETVSTGWTPLLGSSGYNNFCNNYGWVMKKVDNRIFAGTMDFCSLSYPNAPANPNDPFGWVDPTFTKISGLGFDLWKISGGAGDALPTVVPETTNAFKDFNNPGVSDIYTYVPYGNRTLVASSDQTKLFIGTASGNNLNAVGQGNGFTLLMLDSIAQASCSWDIEPEGDTPDYDVDGKDLNAAANMGLLSAQLQELSQQFGNANCK